MKINNLPFTQLDKINTFVSSESLEDQLIQAFGELNEEKAIELINQGANPNQMVPFTKKIMAEYLDKIDLCDCGGEVKKDAAYYEELNSDDTFEAGITEFFDGRTSHPILFLAILLEKENLALALIEKGVNLSWEFKREEEETFRTNVLIEAGMYNCYQVVEHLLKNTNLSILEKGDCISLIRFALSLVEIATSFEDEKLIELCKTYRKEELNAFYQKEEMRLNIQPSWEKA